MRLARRRSWKRFELLAKQAVASSKKGVVVVPAAQHPLRPVLWLKNPPPNIRSASGANHVGGSVLLLVRPDAVLRSMVLACVVLSQ